MKDYYVKLQVPYEATGEEIRAAYKRLAMMYHPDKRRGRPDDPLERAHEQFAEISEAYHGTAYRARSRGLGANSRTARARADAGGGKRMRSRGGERPPVVRCRSARPTVMLLKSPPLSVRLARTMP